MSTYLRHGPKAMPWYKRWWYRLKERRAMRAYRKALRKGRHVLAGYRHASGFIRGG